MRLPFKQLISVGLIILYGANNIVLGALAEANIWRERRKQAAMLRPNPVVDQLPPLSNVLPVSSKWSDSNKTQSRFFSRKFSALLDSIPLNYGSIQDIYFSGDEKASSVVFFQDVHLNSEAQQNIAALLQELINQRKIGMVGVEGAFESFDLKPFRDVPLQTRRLVSDSFLKKSLLAAPSYVGIMSPTDPPPFVGVDDKKHYDANVRAYLSSRGKKQKVLDQIGKMSRDLNEAKKKTFGSELMKFDALRTGYEQASLGLGEYVKKLSVIYAALPKNSSSPPHWGGARGGVPQFLEAYRLESTLDFTRVEQERRRVLEQLSRKLTANETSALVADSMAYRLGRGGAADYYSALKKLCSAKNISLRQTPAFENYIRYVQLADGIKADALFESVRRLAENLVKTLARTPEEKRLVQENEYVALTGKLIEFSLTPREWARYQELRASVPSPFRERARVRAKPKQSAGSALTPTLSLKGEGELAPFESFYEEAEIRSEVMAETLISKSQTLNSKQNKNSNLALVCGGFHTPQIAAFLKEKKISYVVVSPKVTKIDGAGGSAYLSVFAREKTPLDKLFEGEKLFVSPARVQISNACCAIPWLVSAAAWTSRALSVDVKRVWKGQTFFIEDVKGQKPSDDTYRPKMPLRFILFAAAIGFVVLYPSDSWTTYLFKFVIVVACAVEATDDAEKKKPTDPQLWLTEITKNKTVRHIVREIEAYTAPGGFQIISDDAALEIKPQGPTLFTQETNLHAADFRWKVRESKSKLVRTFEHVKVTVNFNLENPRPYFIFLKSILMVYWSVQLLKQGRISMRGFFKLQSSGLVMWMVDISLVCWRGPLGLTDQEILDSVLMWAHTAIDLTENDLRGLLPRHTALAVVRFFWDEFLKFDEYQRSHGWILEQIEHPERIVRRPDDMPIAEWKSLLAEKKRKGAVKWIENFFQPRSLKIYGGPRRSPFTQKILDLLVEHSKASTAGSAVGVYVPKQTRRFAYPAGNFGVEIENPNNNYAKTPEGAVSVGMSMLERPLHPAKEDYPRIVIAPKDSWVGVDGSNLMQLAFSAGLNFFAHGRKTVIVCTKEQEQRIRNYLDMADPRSVESTVYPDAVKARMQSEAVYNALRTTRYIGEDGKIFEGTNRVLDILDAIEFKPIDAGVAQVGSLEIRSRPDGDFDLRDGQNHYRIQGKNLTGYQTTFHGAPTLDQRPEFGLTTLGQSNGGDPEGLTSNQIIWAGPESFLVDIGAATVDEMKALHLTPKNISRIVLTHIHEDHVVGALAYFHWATEHGQPIRLMMEPDTYQLFRHQANQILGKDLESVYKIELTSLPFEQTVILGSGDERVEIEPMRMFHGPTTLGLRVIYKGKTIVHSSDTAYDPARYEKVKALFGAQRVEELLTAPFRRNARGDPPALINFEAGARNVTPGNNTTNHTSPYDLANLPEPIQRSMIVHHTGALPDGKFLFKLAKPLQTIEVPLGRHTPFRTTGLSALAFGFFIAIGVVVVCALPSMSVYEKYAALGFLPMMLGLAMAENNSEETLKPDFRDERMLALSNHKEGGWPGARSEWNIAGLTYVPERRQDFFGNHPMWIYRLTNTKNGGDVEVGRDDAKHLFPDKKEAIDAMQAQKQSELDQVLKKAQTVARVQRWFGWPADPNIADIVSDERVGDQNIPLVDQAYAELEIGWNSIFTGVALEWGLEMVAGITRALPLIQSGRISIVSAADAVRLSQVFRAIDGGVTEVAVEDLAFVFLMHKRILAHQNHYAREVAGWSLRRAKSVNIAQQIRTPAFHANLWSNSWLRKNIGDELFHSKFLDVGANLSVSWRILSSLQNDDDARAIDNVIDLENDAGLYDQAPNPHRALASIADLTAQELPRVRAATGDTVEDLFTQPHQFKFLNVSFVLDQLEPLQLRDAIIGIDRLLALPPADGTPVTLQTIREFPLLVVASPEHAPLANSLFDQAMQHAGYVPIVPAQQITNRLTPATQDWVRAEAGEQAAAIADMVTKPFHVVIYAKTKELDVAKWLQLPRKTFVLRTGANSRAAGDGKPLPWTTALDLERLNILHVIEGLRTPHFETEAQNVVPRSIIDEDPRYAEFEARFTSLLFARSALKKSDRTRMDDIESAWDNFQAPFLTEDQLAFVMNTPSSVRLSLKEIKNFPNVYNALTVELAQEELTQKRTLLRQGSINDQAEKRALKKIEDDIYGHTYSIWEIYGREEEVRQNKSMNSVMTDLRNITTRRILRIRKIVAELAREKQKISVPTVAQKLGLTSTGLLMWAKGKGIDLARLGVEDWRSIQENKMQQIPTAVATLMARGKRPNIAGVAGLIGVTGETLSTWIQEGKIDAVSLGIKPEVKGAPVDDEVRIIEVQSAIAQLRQRNVKPNFMAIAAELGNITAEGLAQWVNTLDVDQQSRLTIEKGRSAESYETDFDPEQFQRDIRAAVENLVARKEIPNIKNVATEIGRGHNSVVERVKEYGIDLVSLGVSPGVSNATVDDTQRLRELTAAVLAVKTRGETPNLSNVAAEMNLDRNTLDGWGAAQKIDWSSHGLIKGRLSDVRDKKIIENIKAVVAAKKAAKEIPSINAVAKAVSRSARGLILWAERIELDLKTLGVISPNEVDSVTRLKQIQAAVQKLKDQGIRPSGKKVADTVGMKASSLLTWLRNNNLSLPQLGIDSPNARVDKKARNQQIMGVAEALRRSGVAPTVERVAEQMGMKKKTLGDWVFKNKIPLASDDDADAPTGERLLSPMFPIFAVASFASDNVFVQGLLVLAVFGYFGTRLYDALIMSVAVHLSRDGNINSDNDDVFVENLIRQLSVRGTVMVNYEKQRVYLDGTQTHLRSPRLIPVAGDRGFPSEADLLALARKENVPVKYVDVGDLACCFLFHFDRNTDEKSVAYAKTILARQALSRKQWQQWEQAIDTGGIYVEADQSKLFGSLASGLHLSGEAFLDRLQLPADTSRFILIFNHGDKHKALFEEIIHMLEGTRRPDYGGQIMETVNDFIQLLFYWKSALPLFTSGYTLWSAGEKIFMHERYVGAGRFNPNTELTQILRQLLADLEKDGALAEIFLREERNVKVMKPVTPDFNVMRMCGSFLRSYLTWLIQNNKFKDYTPVFEHWEPEQGHAKPTLQEILSLVTEKTIEPPSQIRSFYLGDMTPKDDVLVYYSERWKRIVARVRATELILCPLNSIPIDLLAPAHGVCTSCDIRATDNKGMPWIGHAHIHPWNEEFGKAGTTFRQFGTLCEFLEKEGFHDVRLVLSLQDPAKGMPHPSEILAKAESYGFKIKIIPRGVGVGADSYNTQDSVTLLHTDKHHKKSVISIDWSSVGNDGNNEDMTDVDWLATLMLGVMNKDLTALSVSRELDVAHFGQARNDTNAQRMARIGEQILQPEFQEQLAAAIREKLAVSKNHIAQSEVERRSEQTAELLVAYFLANERGIDSDFAGEAAFVFQSPDGESIADQRLRKIAVMASLIQYGGTTDARQDIISDAKSKTMVDDALRILQLLGWSKRVSSQVEHPSVLVRPSIYTPEGVLKGAQQIYFDDQFLAPLRKIRWNDMIDAFRRALKAA